MLFLIGASDPFSSRLTKFNMRSAEPLMLEIKLIILLMAANGAPILLHWLLEGRYTRPLDGGLLLADGRPLFGPSKTVTGLIAAVVLTSFVAWLFGWSPLTGCYIAALAMGGDLLASFIKRRLAIPASGIAPGLDQIPESLLPLIGVRGMFDLGWIQIFIMVMIFIVLDYALSFILYHFHIRKHPY
jgi:CDP-2,3-bis-(O-geranylgeranyl)-sn-glycerol synthase